MKYQAQISDKTFDIFIQKKENDFEVEIDDEKISIDLKQIERTNTYLFFLYNHLFEVEIDKNEASYILHHKGKSYRCQVEDERFAKLKNSIKQQSGIRLENEIKSPMPGLVVTIEVKVGQHVKAGQGLIIIEAMKMENEIKAPFDCIVKEIKVKEKQAVEKGQVLVVFGA